MAVNIELFQVLSYSQWQGNTINLTDGMSKTTESRGRNDTLQQLTDQRRTNWRVIFPGNSLTDDNSRHISGSQKCTAMIFAHFANSVPLSISAKRPPTSGGLLDAERRNGTGAALRPYFTHFRANSVFGHYASPHYSVISKTPLVIIQFPRIRKLDFVREIVL